PLRAIAALYINVVRGVPDVLFFLFFPLAFEQLVEWVRAQVDSPALCFNYDHSHFVLRGISPEEAAAIMVPHAAATHLKDAAGDPARFQFMLPGEGDFDYPAFFRLLAGLGYDGYLTVEVSGMVFNRPGYEPVSEARRCQEFLSAALAAAAL
ncbi:MAG: sugar phosphate isomerase/epimerase, partial [Armatimonadetes bacterium]|nr:sugar phosphate isomerase/epimerase [Armatimonadota bacterium]